MMSLTPTRTKNGSRMHLFSILIVAGNLCSTLGRCIKRPLPANFILSLNLTCPVKNSRPAVKNSGGVDGQKLQRLSGGRPDVSQFSKRQILGFGGQDVANPRRDGRRSSQIEGLTISERARRRSRCTWLMTSSQHPCSSSIRSAQRRRRRQLG